MTRGKYTVNEVEERTKVPGSTLRQWERRYGFPKPERSDAGYRLYSDQDLGHIDDMKRHIAEGIPASRAAELVRGVLPLPVGPRSLPALQQELVSSLVGFDEGAADRVVSEAFSLHPTDAVARQVIAGSVDRLADLWQQKSLEAAVVQFGASYVYGRLRGLLASGVVSVAAPAVLIACAPGNRHELGPLLLALMLRRAGYRAYFLGADAAVADLVTLAARLKPVAVMVSAAGLESLELLERDCERLRGIAPILGFGGAAFNRFPESALSLGGIYLGHDVVEGLDGLRQRHLQLESA